MDILLADIMSTTIPVGYRYIQSRFGVLTHHLIGPRSVNCPCTVSSRFTPTNHTVSSGLFTTYREVVPDFSSWKSVTFPVFSRSKP